MKKNFLSVFCVVILFWGTAHAQGKKAVPATGKPSLAKFNKAAEWIKDKINTYSVGTKDLVASGNYRSTGETSRIKILEISTTYLVATFNSTSSSNGGYSANHTFTFEIPIKEINEIKLDAYTANTRNAYISTKGKNIVMKYKGTSSSGNDSRDFDESDDADKMTFSVVTGSEENFIARFNRAAKDMLDYITTLQNKDY